MSTTFRSQGFNAFPRDPVYKNGKQLLTVTFRQVVLAAAAAAGDIYILSGEHPYDWRVAHINGVFPAAAGATSIDIGFYKKNSDGTFSPILSGGGNELVSAADLHSGQAYNDLLELNSGLDRTKSIGAIMSLTSEQQQPNAAFIGLRSNNQITAGTFTLALDVVLEQATTK